MSPLALETAVGGAVLLAATASLAALLGTRPAGLRHTVWTVGLGATLAFPLAARSVPDWLPVSVPPDGALAAVPGWTFGVWVTGALGVLALGLAEALAFRAIRRRSAPVTDPRTRRVFLGLVEEVGIDREPRLLEGPPGTTPKTWGHRRGVLLLPPECREWSEERLQLVLLHELLHLERGDWLAQWVATLACALHWFDPLAWLAAARLRIERERACDEAVLRRGVPPSRYAAALLDLARTGPRPRGGLAPLVAGGRGSIADRVAAILRTGRPADRPTAGSRLGIGLAALATCVLLAGVGVSPAPLEGQAVEALIDRSDAWVDPASRPAFERAVAGLCSRDQRRVYAAVLSRADLDPADRAAALRAASVIDRSADLATLLVDFAARTPIDGDVRSAYVEASRAIDLDRERARALSALPVGIPAT